MWSPFTYFPRLLSSYTDFACYYHSYSHSRPPTYSDDVIDVYIVALIYFMIGRILLTTMAFDLILATKYCFQEG